MNFDAWLKVFLIVAYTCFIAFVPEMPNYYTFMVNCCGFAVTLSATIFLIWFLGTRPPAQRNVLNRIIALYTMALYLGTLRTFVLSVFACFWNTELQEFVETYPMLTTLLLSLRWSLILSCTFIFAISASRLLLFLKPVVFHRIQPNMGALITSLVAVLASASDIIYTWAFSTRNVSLEKSMHMVVFKTEMGIQRKSSENETANCETNSSTTYKTTDNETPYSFLPWMQILIFGSLILEVTKVVYAFTKEYIKLKKANQVKTTSEYITTNASTPQEHNGLKRVKQIQTGKQQELRHSLSLPKIKSSSNPKIYTKRVSLPNLHFEEKKSGKNNFNTSASASQVPPDIVFTSQVPSDIVITSKIPSEIVSTSLDKKSVKKLKDMVRHLCLRTASLVTVFGLVGVMSMVVSSFTYTTSSWSVVLQITMCRLVSYFLNVLLIFFDKDIFDFYKQKLVFFSA